MSRARALLLVVLAAVLTTLAGPSAAAHVGPADVLSASVLGIAPNGDHATARAAHLTLPAHPTVPSVAPGDGVTLTAPIRAETTVQIPHGLTYRAGTTSQHDRAPPTG